MSEQQSRMMRKIEVIEYDPSWPELFRVTRLRNRTKFKIPPTPKILRSIWETYFSQ